jgi:proteasome accessory factor C
MITVMLDDDGSVLAWQGPYFNRPMRLTPTEGFAVLAAGRTLLAVPGADAEGPLASALAKLDIALGPSGSVSVELEAPPLLAAVRNAAESGQRLAVSHFSAWRDELTERTIDPWLVFSQDGHWYVMAMDSRSGSVRHFRVDRLAEAEPTGETFERPAGVAPPGRVLSGLDTTEVVLCLPGSARWVAETYDPLEVEELEGDRLRVRLVATGERWLERLLLRVGPEARVEEPDSWTAVGAIAAQRLLSRYGG